MNQHLSRVALIVSLVFHLSFLFIFFYGVPDFLRTKPIQSEIIPIEIVPADLPVREKTNIKPPEPKVEPIEGKEEPQKEPPKKVVQDKPVIEEKPKPEEKKPEPKKDEKKEKVEPKKEAPVKKKEEKKDQKKDEKKPDKKPEDKTDQQKNFDALLKSIEKMQEPQKRDASTQNFDPTAPLSISDIDAIRQQVSRHWSVPAGARDAQNMQVTLQIQILPDGTVTKVDIVDQSRYGGDPFWRASADSAVRAVFAASPFQGLPTDKYDVWKNLEVVFDPKELIH